MAQAGPVIVGRFIVGTPPWHHAEPVSQIFADAKEGHLTVPDAVTRMYWSVLGRAPDPAGYGFYAGALAGQYGFYQNAAQGLAKMFNDFVVGAAPELTVG